MRGEGQGEKSETGLYKSRAEKERSEDENISGISVTGLPVWVIAEAFQQNFSASADAFVTHCDRPDGVSRCFVRLMESPVTNYP